MQVTDHFLDDVEMDVYQTLDFEPLRTVFPELRGSRLVRGILVD